MVPRKIEEKKKPLEFTMKAHEIIKPQPRTFSSRSLWLNEKHNNNFDIMFFKEIFIYFILKKYLNVFV